MQNFFCLVNRKLIWLWLVLISELCWTIIICQGSLPVTGCKSKRILKRRSWITKSYLLFSYYYDICEWFLLVKDDYIDIFLTKYHAMYICISHNAFLVRLITNVWCHIINCIFKSHIRFSQENVSPSTFCTNLARRTWCVPKGRRSDNALWITSRADAGMMKLDILCENAVKNCSLPSWVNYFRYSILIICSFSVVFCIKFTNILRKIRWQLTTSLWCLDLIFSVRR